MLRVDIHQWLHHQGFHSHGRWQHERLCSLHKFSKGGADPDPANGSALVQVRGWQPSSVP